MNLGLNLRNSAANVPDAAAILFMDKRISYRELDGLVDRFAAGLQALGHGKGSRIALLLGNTPAFVIAYYAIARIGAVSVPINPLYTPGEIQYVLADAGVEAVIAVAQMAPMFGMMRKVLPNVRTAIVAGELDAAVEGVLPFDAVYSAEIPKDADQATENDCAVILYTSGTTGNPKGAMLSHRNLVSNAEQCVDFLGVLQSDIVVAVLPMFHVFCMTVCMNTPIYRGATVLVIPRFSPTETAKTMEEAGATFFAGVPTMFNFLVQHPECQPEQLKALRYAISGGAPMPVAVLHNFEQKYGVKVSEGYGLSEASPVVCFNPIDRERKPGTIGVPLPGVDVRVVDEEGRDCDPGVVGELICKGPNVMIGYLNRPEDTAAAIRDGWLYTGDLATVDEEGYFSIVDRKKDMVLVGGFNVYPREVEEVLFKHPAVREAAVIGLPDANYGEKVRAYVALKGDVSVEALIEYCAEHLAKYKVPKEILVLDELPKNTTGKILRRELKKSELPSG